MDFNFFQQAVDAAKAYRDRVVDRASSVVVVPLVVGPDNQTYVPCGESSFARCVADQFERGRLTITAIDDDTIMRIYEPGTWSECTVYGPDDHILYGFMRER